MSASFTSYTPADDSLSGFANAITGAGPFTMTTKNSGDSLSHLASIQSAANLAAITFTLTGTDPDGNAQTEAIVGPNIATVYGLKYWKTLNTVSVSSTLGANTANIGWKDDCVGATFPLDWRQDSFAVSLGIDVSGTINYTIEHTFRRMSDGFPSTFLWLPHSSLVTKTVDSDGNYAFPVTATRLHVNSLTAGATIGFHVVQAR
jgi:hypothetical protein